MASLDFSEDVAAYVSRIQRQNLGVWLNAKVQCGKCKQLIPTGTMSHQSHYWIWTYCENCKAASLMRVVEIDPDPDANKPRAPLAEEE